MMAIEENIIFAETVNGGLLYSTHKKTPIAKATAATRFRRVFNSAKGAPKVAPRTRSTVIVHYDKFHCNMQMKNLQKTFLPT